MGAAGSDSEGEDAPHGYEPTPPSQLEDTYRGKRARQVEEGERETKNLELLAQASEELGERATAYRDAAGKRRAARHAELRAAVARHADGVQGAAEEVRQTRRLLRRNGTAWMEEALCEDELALLSQPGNGAVDDNTAGAGGCAADAGAQREGALRPQAGAERGGGDDDAVMDNAVDAGGACKRKAEKDAGGDGMPKVKMKLLRNTPQTHRRSAKHQKQAGSGGGL